MNIFPWNLFFLHKIHPEKIYCIFVAFLVNVLYPEQTKPKNVWLKPSALLCPSCHFTIPNSVIGFLSTKLYFCDQSGHPNPPAETYSPSRSTDYLVEVTAPIIFNQISYINTHHNIRRRTKNWIYGFYLNVNEAFQVFYSPRSLVRYSPQKTGMCRKTEAREVLGFRAGDKRRCMGRRQLPSDA